MLVLKIVILHCHYERGGVTQVVENHVRALLGEDQIEQIVLVAGSRNSGLSPETLAAVTLIEVEDFDYDSQPYSAASLPERSAQITERLTEQLAAAGVDRDNAVLHWHNHGLGKNTASPEVIRRLATSGWKLLAQIHDFAEDNRPENYGRLIEATGATGKQAIDQYLYPVASQIHYATLTNADAAILTQIGIPAERTHCLPNSVVLPSGEPDRNQALEKIRRAAELPDDASWCLYPVRGIRRKNVGEFLLLSRWLKPNQFAGLTLCPATEVEKRSYQRWQALAAEVAPRAVFDAGHLVDVSFGENIAAADFIVSTSVAEGFGMAFLEPWLAHREVIARRLGTVTDDFEACGMRFPKLYDAVNIPGDQSWLERCRRESAEAAEAAWSTVPEPFRPQLSLDMNDDDQIDFAALTPRAQTEVLQRIASDDGFESAVQERGRELIDRLTASADPELIQANAELVARRYSPDQTREQLVAIYQQLAAADSEPQVDSPAAAGMAVDLISGLRPIYPCRTEVLDG